MGTRVCKFAAAAAGACLLLSLALSLWNLAVIRRQQASNPVPGKFYSVDGRPVVLTGHSAGGFYVREYAREFPAEVGGVVLVDSTSPRQIDELPGFRASYEADKRDARRQLWRDRVRGPNRRHGLPASATCPC